MSNDSGTTFTCTLEEFKRAVAEFCQAAPTCDEQSLESGFKAVGLLYLGLPDNELTLLTARGYLDYASRRHLEREIELMREPEKIDV